MSEIEQMRAMLERLGVRPRELSRDYLRRHGVPDSRRVLALDADLCADVTGVLWAEPDTDIYIFFDPSGALVSIGLPSPDTRRLWRRLPVDPDAT